ncbi:MAG: ABC transporter ATP-binding protein, partial [Schaalia hyovaginalis]
PLGPDQAEEMLARLCPSLPPAPADSPETPSPDAGPREDDPLLEARGLGFSRSRTPILKDVDLRIAKGETVALIGANGAGKTTLLRLLAGLEAPSSGTILRPGREGLARRRHSHSNCTLVTQNPEHQFVTSNVRDELAHGMRLAKTPRAEIDRTVEGMLSDYGLADVADRNPFTLSGGQKRRLSVAAALSSPRELLLLDEPTFGQDGRSIRALMERAREFTSRRGAVLLTTHDLEIASTYADRVIVLAGGSIGAQGPAHRILSDDGLLESLGLLATPLTRIAAQARLAGAPVPRWSSWSEVPVLEEAPR